MPPKNDDGPILNIEKPQEWREWLEQYGRTEKKAWVLARYKNSKLPGMRMNDIIAHALCYGWSDSMLLRKQDDDTFYVRCAPRRPESVWGKKYRDLAEQMIATGSMQPEGQALIDQSKTAGSWEALENPKATTIPDDLQALLDKDKIALKNFQSFSTSSRRWILQWIADAKRPETRMQRVTQTAELASKNIRAHHPEAKAYIDK